MWAAYFLPLEQNISLKKCYLKSEKLLYTHLLRLKNTCKLLKCLSAVNCRIMEPAAVNYQGKLRQLTTKETSNFFFFDKNHKLLLLIFIDFDCFNHYFCMFQTIAVLYLCIYNLIRISFKS